jgi:hypothetical protein
MTTSTQKRTALDSPVPSAGRASDAYEVACTALILLKAGSLRSTEWLTDSPILAPARHATLLHIISGKLHRIAERQCNEDLACPQCHGEGVASHPGDDDYPMSGKPGPCRACAGRGNTLGRRESKLERDATEIASHYGLRVYFQGDPRGCSLYLIDPAMVPKSWAAVPGDPLESYVYDRESANPPALEILQARWIAANYNRGHAVVRLGR